MRDKTCIILGTRPEIIKMSPVIRECERREIDYFILHTGQHYSYEMDKVFFEQLGLPDVKDDLDCKPQMKFEYEFENAHWVVCLELGG